MEQQELSGMQDSSYLREIAIALDSYDDIFSDFDPRPYSQRELSEDFLKEIQRRYMEDKKGRFEVRFTVPLSVRDPKEEVLIKKRLREHFAMMAKQEEEAIKNTRSKGYIYMLSGSLILLSEVFMLFFLSESDFFFRILSILLVPAGWYGMWNGLEKIIDAPSALLERKALYEKFEKANYLFISDEKE